MNNVKLSIIYYSMTGINYKMAKWAKEEAERLGAQVRLVKAQELAPQAVIDANPAWKGHQEETKDIKVASTEDLIWADAIIFSTPTRFGNIASQMKQFMDIQGGAWAKGDLENKVVSAMSSANNDNGGQEATIRALYTTMMHWGAIIVAPGYTDESCYVSGGNPYGTTVTVRDGEMKENPEIAIKHQTRRTLEYARLIKLGRERDEAGIH